ncbi:YqjD family protein [Tropicimonas sp. IMCC34043]|uniref:DUF883 family protein n=1 Tax=Tropicimonas sp. IMCC34043 TaxID=2248760 RepID=UPI001300A813|nr:hypothetical protein [Tropicimonas sp. IMCC34043]
MIHDSKTTKGASVDSDLEEVSRQMAALREDMAKLAQSVTGIAGRRGSGMAADLAEGFGEARNYAVKTGRSAEARLEGTVAAHPLLVIGLAVGAGLLIGALSRR